MLGMTREIPLLALTLYTLYLQKMVMRAMEKGQQVTDCCISCFSMDFADTYSIIFCRDY
jgi:hypothetical protein